MYLGIDLGTSNSAIVGNLNSDLRLFKSADGTDVLPSVIHIDRRGHKFVGVRAYEQAFRSPENVAQGFKRLMGTNTPIRLSASETTMTPEEASGEIIRTLVGQAASETGETENSGAIVTIPAAFNQMQSEATIRAANDAGLERVGLLQEPIAAAMAAMSQSKNKNGQFLVFDLGGGTFDLALVQSLSGSVNIVAHEGINMLGGRDFDRSILNSLVRPWLLNQFDLPEDYQTADKYRRLVRMAQWASERAKIELSSKDQTTIFAGDDDIQVKDEAGDSIYLEVELSRGDLEDLVSERIDETITLSRKILKDHGYSHEDIDKIVFIGGPSKMPCIREKVPQELGIPSDLQTDPMTAVALGAAIFAESREWSESGTKRKTTRSSSTTSGPVKIKYNYPSRTSEDRVRIKVQPSDKTDTKGFEIQVDTGDGWSSGQKGIESGMTLEVPISTPGDNAIRIIVFNPSGAPVPEASSTFTITRTHAAAAGIPATQTISVKVVEGASDAARNVLEPLVEKGTLLPAKGSKKFRAARDLKSGDPEHIDLELYQHAKGVPEPELNLFVGSFRISGDDIPTSLAIRKEDEINVKWNMDDNGLLSATIEIPSISQIFDTGRFYADIAGHQNFEGADGTQLADAVIDDAALDLESVDEVLGDTANEEISNLKQRLNRQQETLEHAHDADTRRSVTEEARQIRQSLSRLKHAPENRGLVLMQQLIELSAEYERDVRFEADPRSNERFDQLAATTRAALERGDQSALKEAERALSEMQKVYFQEVYQQPGYLLGIFKALSEERYLATDKELFDQLVQEGLEAVAENDLDTLRGIIGRMFENMFSVGKVDKSISLLAGLMRA